MKNLVGIFLAFLMLALLVASTYTVQEHQQAIILQLGKVKGAPITKAGLHFKIPFIQDVKYFEKRILQWDGAKSEITTLEKKFIWVDTTARWRISNALEFYRAVRNLKIALDRMGPIINGAVKDAVSSYRLTETVRNNNQILQDIKQNFEKDQKSAIDSDLIRNTADIEKITLGREKLSQIVAERARNDLHKLGIELIDVQFRSIAYQESVESKVFQSMIEERSQIALGIRSSGTGESQRIKGELNLSLNKIRSEAYRKSQEIKGAAEAKATAIYAKALKKDPKFFEFMKTLDTYKETLSKNGNFILSTENAFLRLLKNGS